MKFTYEKNEKKNGYEILHPRSIFCRTITVLDLQTKYK